MKEIISCLLKQNRKPMGLRKEEGRPTVWQFGERMKAGTKSTVIWEQICVNVG